MRYSNIFEKIFVRELFCLTIKSRTIVITSKTAKPVTITNTCMIHGNPSIKIGSKKFLFLQKKTECTI